MNCSLRSITMLERLGLEAGQVVRQCTGAGLDHLQRDQAVEPEVSRLDAR
jgi:hypothetical protein